MAPKRLRSKVFDQLVLNVISHSYEDLGRYATPVFTECHEDIARSIGQAIQTEGLIKLTSLQFRSDIELGFERAVRGANREVALVVLGSAEDAYDYIAAARGTPSSVRIPIEVVMPHLLARARRKIRTHILLIHNHPSNPIKDFFEELVGLPMGPSSQDRRVSGKWGALPEQVQELVKVEILLFESGGWRRISLPSSDQIIEELARFFELL